MVSADAALTEFKPVQLLVAHYICKQITELVARNLESCSE